MDISQGITKCNKNTAVLAPMQREFQFIPQSPIFSSGDMSEWQIGCESPNDPAACPTLVPSSITYEFEFPCSVGIARRSPPDSNTYIWPTEPAASYHQAIRQCNTGAAAIKPGWMRPAPIYPAPSPAGGQYYSKSFESILSPAQTPMNLVHNQPSVPWLADSYLGGNSPMPSYSSHTIPPVIKTDAPYMTIPTPTELLALETTNSIKIKAHDVSMSRLERKPRQKNAARRLARSYTRSGTKKAQAVMRAEAKAGKDRSRKLSVILGLEPTDPDTISVHERKRSYCESLEQYVLYLHEQLRLTNNEPAPIERLTEYRGLTSRSVRTLLAHINSRLEVVHDKIQEAEREFLDLRRQVIEKLPLNNPQEQEEPEESGQVNFLSMALQMLDEE